jgi:hypothetical protein
MYSVVLKNQTKKKETAQKKTNSLFLLLETKKSGQKSRAPLIIK